MTGKNTDAVTMHKKTNRKEYDFYTNFDLDDNAEEEFVNNWLGKVEYKSESYEIWSKNGNIFVEFQQSFPRGRDEEGNTLYTIPQFSGIYVTEADIWCHQLKDENGNLYCPLYLRVSDLKKLIKSKVYRTGTSFHYDTSNVKTEGFLIPLTDIKKYFYNFFD